MLRGVTRWRGSRDLCVTSIRFQWFHSRVSCAATMLELHVWGPAFLLPSIDAQCLATIAYFVQAVPKEAWVLVPSSDPSLSPTSKSLIV